MRVTILSHQSSPQVLVERLQATGRLSPFEGAEGHHKAEKSHQVARRPSNSLVLHQTGHPSTLTGRAIVPRRRAAMVGFLPPSRGVLFLMLLAAAVTRSRKLQQAEYELWVRQLDSCTDSIGFQLPRPPGYVWRIPEHLAPAGLYRRSHRVLVPSRRDTKAAREGADVVAIVIGATAAFSVARRGRARKVSGAREDACMCAREATCVAIGAARCRRCCHCAAWATRPGRPRFTRVLCRAVAGPSAVAAPPPRSAPPAVKGGGRAQRPPHARAAFGTALADCGSFGGVHGPRAACCLPGQPLRGRFARIMCAPH